ncbi:hypothetical protein NF865_04425 [Thermococcus aggregans]|uniref:Tetratricopeptide repeat protein n=1 Tax=Thermococcus aggregans TaxID=110163 RepID=A0A9E7MZ02_THEAG|nr:hypothetical protein [Thermococcus aggregans]USS41434.1 hypothetical protein NF865_04425 [Thermococcus aggregans]
MITGIIRSSPGELELAGKTLVTKGDLKSGMRLLIKSAREYERQGRVLDAARIYRYIGDLILSADPQALKDARPFLLKSAYYYLDLLEREIELEEPNLELFDEFCSNILRIFEILGENNKFEKYAREFAIIYKSIGDIQMRRHDIQKAIESYETAYRYHKTIHNSSGISEVGTILVDLYGKGAEIFISEKEYQKAGDTFFKLAFIVKDVFGYDDHFMELMENAGRNYEKAGKEWYAYGDLYYAAKAFLKAEYSYLLAGNSERTELIGLDTAKMLYQLAGEYRKKGFMKELGDTLVMLAQSLFALDKLLEGLKTYKELINEAEVTLEHRYRIRKALLFYLAAKERSRNYLEFVEQMEFYAKREAYAQAIDLAELIFETRFPEIKKGLQKVEGFSPE